MVKVHKAGYSDEDHCLPYKYNILSQSQNEEDEHLNVCCICCEYEGQQKCIMEHMYVVHDTPLEECAREH